MAMGDDARAFLLIGVSVPNPTTMEPGHWNELPPIVPEAERSVRSKAEGDGGFTVKVTFPFASVAAVARLAKPEESGNIVRVALRVTVAARAGAPAEVTCTIRV